MPKVISLSKNLRRFKPSDKLTLILLQALTFGVYNARLNLKGRGSKFRQSEILTVLVVGELKETGCKVSDFSNLFGYQNSVSRNVLNRSVNRGLLYKTGGRKGRGHSTNYYLGDRGFMVFEVLQKELGKTFQDAKNEYRRNIIRRLNRVY